MKRFKYVGPHPEVEVPALGVVVTKNSILEVEDPEISAGLEGQTDVWKKQTQSRPAKKATKKAAPKTTTAGPDPDPAPVVADSTDDDSAQEG